MDAKILAVYPYEKIDYFVHFAALAPFLPSPAGSPKRSIIAAKRTLCDRQELEETDGDVRWVRTQSAAAAIELTLYQDDAGVIAQARTVGKRAHIFEEALGGGVCSRKMLLKTDQSILFVRLI